MVLGLLARYAARPTHHVIEPSKLLLSLWRKQEAVDLRLRSVVLQRERDTNTHAHTHKTPPM